METLDKHFRVLAATAFKSHGFAQGDLLSHWPEIVGEGFAGLCAPERIKWPKPKVGETSAAGTLVVRAAAGRSLDVQYGAQGLKDRINQFMGFAAIAKIKVMGEQRLSPLPQPVAAPQTIMPVDKLNSIADPALKEALARLGAGVFKDAARNRPRSPQEK